MARINVLPKNIAELIAAGEVVERPASVVKELAENAIDAGASAITVEIKNGGITYIRVTDNGCGIFRGDVQKAFMSHATSKIGAANDLDGILTLGFRGEALPSVAAVAQVEVLTKSAEEPEGTSFAVRGGSVLKNEPAGCPNGTTVVVRDLFYNTPARMKFLKRDISEANAVSDVLDKLSLSHPEISFKLIREGKRTLLTPGDSKLLSAAYAVFGRDFSDSMLETEYELDGVKVSGLIGKPLFSKASRSMQIFFVNGRYIKSRACSASLENAYKNSIMVGKFPACVLNISVPAQLVDVNVHPAKTEVRFSDERRIFSAVYYAVKSALENDEQRPKLDVTKAVVPAVRQGEQLFIKTEAPAKTPPRPDFWQSMKPQEYKAAPELNSPKTENPFLKENDEPDLLLKIPSKLRKSEEKPMQPPKREQEPPAETPAHEPKQPSESVRLIGEAFSTYIICEYQNKLCLIDKHAAHERIIFNRLKQSDCESRRQVLLSPATVTLSKNEYSVVTENLGVFLSSGFLVEDFGTGTVIVRECPMMLDPLDAAETVGEIAANLVFGKTDVQTEKIDDILHITACKAAIKAGNKNHPSELISLARTVILDSSVRYCPHGRPVMIELTEYEIEKQFGRIQ